jgi:hypothetical protein
LVDDAFISQVPLDKVRQFVQWLLTYESLARSIGLTKRFTDVQSIFQNIQGWGTSKLQILVIAATEDELMGARLMGGMAGKYSAGIKRISSCN